MTNETKKSITKNDVESVLKYGRLVADGETPDAKDGEAIDLFQTNASKLRSVLGRGSLATIQKHLSALRNDFRAAEEAPAAEEAAKHAPSADAVAVIWNVVVNTACAELLKKISTLSDVHDRDRTIIIEQSESIEELQAECIALEEKVEDATREIAATVIESERQAMAHQTAIEELTVRLDESYKQNKILTDLIEKALQTDTE